MHVKHVPTTLCAQSEDQSDRLVMVRKPMLQ